MGQAEHGCVVTTAAERCVSYIHLFLDRVQSSLRFPDEPDEVVVVKQALIAHLNLDPRVTLSVLCDQIIPPVDATADPDELYMRDRLRTLVLAFLTDEAKQVIVERHAVPGSEAEAVLVDGLLTVRISARVLDESITIRTTGNPEINPHGY